MRPILKQGFITAVQCIGSDEVGTFEENEGERSPVFFESLGEVHQDIIDEKISHLESFKEGDMDFEDVQFESDYYPAFGVIYTDEPHTVYAFDVEKRTDLLFTHKID